MANRLLEEVEYKIDQTKLGQWRRYGYPNGGNFHEFKSHAKVFGWPLLHYTYGVDPQTGRRVVAKGVFAIGRIACGLVAIGQLAIGFIAIGQAAVAILLGLGQLGIGAVAVGQAAGGVLFGLGQFATGYIAIGQFAWGQYVLAQLGGGKFVWSMKQADFEAIKFFKILPIIRDLLP